MNPALAAFLAWLRLDRGLSENTIAAYANDVGDFQKRDLPMDASGAKAFLEALRREGLSDASLSRKTASLRTYFRFHRQQMKSNIRLPELEQIQAPRKLPKLLSREEMEQILSVPDRKTAEGKRDSAALELLYSSGLRASELTSLRPADLLGDASTLRVKGKGGKERIVPVGKNARTAIEIYLRDVYPIWNPGFALEELFLGGKERRLTRQSLWKIVGETAVAAGLGKKISPHMIRHSFASHLRDAGMNLRFLQAILGHSDISTTQIYTHVEETRLREAHQKFHPRK